MDERARSWHLANRMPKNPSLDQRIAWAIGHAENCGCRPVPEGLVAEFKKRGLPVPKPRSA